MSIITNHLSSRIKELGGNTHIFGLVQVMKICFRSADHKNIQLLKPII